MAEERTVFVSNPSSLPIDSDYLTTLQLRFDYRQRKIFANDFADRVNLQAKALGAPTFDPLSGADLAASLHDIGYSRVGSLLSAAAIRDVLAYFDDRPCFNAHVAAQSDGIGAHPDKLAATAHFGSYRPEDVVTAPHILELANDPRILSAVGNYLGCVPSLYSMNAWWSFPRPGQGAAITQSFHRDGDDFKNCVLFLYLTDTDTDGCHQYIRYSHDPDMLAHQVGAFEPFEINCDDGVKLRLSDGLDGLFADSGYGRDDIYHAMFGNLIESIAGAAGDGFLTDPDGLHRATHPTQKRRLIVWLRYGMHRNCAYVRDLLQPVPHAQVNGRLPDTPAARFVNRLVIAPN